MKRTFHSQVTAAILIISLSVPGISQDDDVIIYSTGGDTVNCAVYISVLREFMRMELYHEAIVPWRVLFSDCPASSERMYLDGVTMYRSFIESAPEGPVREGLIDTLMLIYDRRMQYFGGEGNVLGRKGRDLLTYRGTDPVQLENGHQMLRRSIDLEGMDSQEAVMVLCISAGITLTREGIIEKDQVIGDYLTVIGIIDRLQERSPRWSRTREAVDEMMSGGDLLTCEALNGYFETRYEQQREDPSFLAQLISVYSTAGCEGSDIHAAASEALYRVEPGPEAAHNLALLFISRNDLEKAATYLQEALEGTGVARETRAEWYYELAVVKYAVRDYCGSIGSARQAIQLKPDYGKAFILLGDAFIAAREGLGDEFQQRTAFWAAADMYQKALSVEPSVTDEAVQKLNDYSGQYPDNEDVFFHDLKEGETYQVGGCINQQTTIR